LKFVVYIFLSLFVKVSFAQDHHAKETFTTVEIINLD